MDHSLKISVCFRPRFRWGFSVFCQTRAARFPFVQLTVDPGTITALHKLVPDVFS